MYLIEVDGVRILHCGDLGQELLTDRQLKSIGETDVVLIPVGGVYTVDGRHAGDVVRQLRPRFVIPIHYKTPVLRINLQNTDMFVRSLSGGFVPTAAKGNTLAVTHGLGPGRQSRKIVVLNYLPWDMPDALRALFGRMDAAARSARNIFEPVTVGQMNHRPSDGLHTPRWNAEHVMGRQLGFSSSIYSHIDPSLPHLDLNPAQMPDDYKATHPDWTGVEESRQIQRASDLVRRFAYLLDGIDLDAGLEGTFWTIRGLCEQMERHFNKHVSNVKKKFTLPDWPD